MAKYQSRQAGFGLVSIIVVVAVLLVVAGIGFFVSNRHTRTAPANASTTTPPAPAPSKAVTTPTPATPTTSGASLTVKEWGVTIPLPESLKDAYYVPSTSSADPDGSVNTIWLGLKSRDTATCAAALGNTGGSTLGAIVRTLPTDTDPVTGKLYSELYTGVVIGNYFYGFGASVDPGNKCGSVDSRSDINAAFGMAVKASKASSSINADTAQ